MNKANPQPPKGSSLFEDSNLLLVGQDAESIVMDFLNSFKQITKKDDLRLDKEWQEKDVDYRIETANGEMLIEVKSDQHIGKSGNVLFELIRLHHTAKSEHCAYIGWSVFSAADRIFVWCPPTRKLYIFKTPDLRRAMQGYTYEQRKSMRIEIVVTDTKRTTINILVPLAYVSYHVYQKNAKGWECIGQYKASRGLHADEMAA